MKSTENHIYLQQKNIRIAFRLSSERNEKLKFIKSFDNPINSSSKLKLIIFGK